MLACAPAGYGKTSVLASASSQFQAAGRCVAWISLDETDKELNTFVRDLADFIRNAGQRLGQTLSAPIGTGTSLPEDALQALVLDELSTLDRDFHLFLDDYHLVGDPGIRGLVDAILLSPLHRVHLLIATRTHNELAVCRLRALGAIHGFEIADLAFSEREVGEFVTRIHGVPLSEAQVARLRISTEGWSVSLQMSGIALYGSSSVDRFLDQFSGEHRSVGDFLDSAGCAMARPRRVDLRVDRIGGDGGQSRDVPLRGSATSTRMLHDRFVEGGARYGIVFHQTIAGATFAMRGNLSQAKDACELALRAAIELHGQRSALYNMPALMLAELHYERNELRLA